MMRFGGSRPRHLDKSCIRECFTSLQYDFVTFLLFYTHPLVQSIAFFSHLSLPVCVSHFQLLFGVRSKKFKKKKLEEL